jgi:hypothetical protein
MRLLSQKSWSLQVKAAALALGLTAITVAAAIYSGFASRGLTFVSRNVEPEVVALFVPMVAIVCAMFYLALRLTWRGSTPELRANRRRALRWTPDVPRR